jgi:glycogen debranching enzyme
VNEDLDGADFHIHAAPDAGAIQRLVLKHEDSFLVCDRHGDFPAYLEGELGFYHEGTRHLRWLELRLDGVRPLLLGAEISPDNDQISIALTNADLRTGEATIPRNTLFVDRVLSIYDAHLLESLTFVSFHDAPCSIRVELIFSADFADVFEVRGMARARRGRFLGEERDDGHVHIRYLGLDGVERATEILFDPRPTLVAVHRALYELTLAPGDRVRLRVTASARNTEPAPRAAPHFQASLPKLRALAAPLRTGATRIVSDNEGFGTLIARSMVDLEMLLTVTPQGRVPYAGVPWYVAPFGRDSVIAALQLLPYQAEVAAGTLRFLAAWQGRATDDFLDEEPGKILHEYRRGEMANCREIPFIPYYGTVDATPLFVILLDAYARWTGDLGLVRELWPAARASLEWMRDHGDRDGDGYLEYQTRSTLGLRNQGWKDSEDAVMHADGRLARLPIAICEAQGYAYAAWRAGAALAETLGEAEAARDLALRAADLRAAFEREFWLPHEGFYALALDGDKRRCEVIASNPGHCLWAGLIDETRAEAVIKRLLADDMFSGWGMRTLSSRERRYNPMSYHNGSVWPHDNALAAQGFRRYGMGEPIVTLATALFEASRYFENRRVPELYCGFPRHGDQGPIAYPVACAPQAWAAGSMLGMLTALLGFEADAQRNRLTLHSPLLPPWLRWIEIHGLRVGSGRLDLSVVRGRDGASVELVSRQGNVELVVRR